MPAALGHFQVGDDQAVRPLGEHRECLPAVLGRVDFELQAKLEKVYPKA